MQYRTKGTCSTMINLTLDENHVIQDLYFTGGCNGNLQGISKLVIGQRAEDVIPKMNTSCPDQLSKALRQAIGQ